MIEIAIATEDALSEAVLETLVQRSDRPLQIAERLRRQGFGYLKSRMASFNQIARWRPVLVLTDLDQAHCAPLLLRD